jgi:LytS/YehU family sensor histidine kinase
MPFFVIGLVMGILLKIIRASMQKELQDAHIQTAQKAMEFSLLQSQLSPHFLFNVLNNLYGISIEEHQRVPPLLLKLSGLLRYAVYGAKKPFVSLKEELVYIRNYIEFEQIRVSDRLVIQTDIAQTINPDIQIAPLILIVFIENAFKHAKNSLNQKIYISLSLKISGNFIYFTAVNSYRDEKKEDSMPDESSGLGLANTIKRLDLLYGNDYQLKQYAENDQYHVELTLKMQYA